MHYYNPVIETYTVIGVAWIGDPSVNCQSSRLPNIYARVRRLDNTGIDPPPKPTTTTSTMTTTTSTTTMEENPTVFSSRSN